MVVDLDQTYHLQFQNLAGKLGRIGPEHKLK
jgi:hypothetical protein